jgi:hypothetical protein
MLIISRRCRGGDALLRLVADRAGILSVLGAFATILVLDVLAEEPVAHASAPCPQLQELVSMFALCRPSETVA